ncbi:serine--tRNA ligase [bacterium]|nr:serine--tRNA ligase [bacterium]MBU1152971.1 serine--tRNA ligase [bacterium]MBU2599673.1 serine--tRNA ligase [bacterium]
MLDLKFMINHMEKVSLAMKNRGIDFKIVEDLKEFDGERRKYIAEVEELKRKRNIANEEIGERKIKREDAQDLILQIKEVSTKIKELDNKLAHCTEKINNLLYFIPNLPHDSVLVGKDEKDNLEVKRWGKALEPSFPVKSHDELGERLDIIDFKRAAKITGARFALLKGAGAKLERALINFMLDIHTKRHGYLEVLPPFMVNRSSMTGTGQLPKFEKDLFYCHEVDYFLIPTAEVPVTNIHRDEILEEDNLPLYYTAWTPCFRLEAGSYGKDTKGLIRQHQFNKVELVKFTTPETSYQELERLLLNAEVILQELELPYRVVTLCSGDLGFAAAKTYDIEVWVPFQNSFREISSCSNFEDFQARRANIKYRRREDKKVEYVHTLNGSGLAIGRTLVAILENYQQEDGSIIIPEKLRPYLDGQKEISRR